MKRYPWPGNVRELENLIRRLAALYPQDEISAEIIEAGAQDRARRRRARAAASLPDDLSIGQAVEHYLQRYFGAFAGELPPPGLYQRMLAEVEYPLVLASMTATRGNQIKAAELLGAQPQHAAQEDPRARASTSTSRRADRQPRSDRASETIAKFPSSTLVA